MVNEYVFLALFFGGYAFLCGLIVLGLKWAYYD